LYDPVRQAIGLGHAGWQGCVRDLPGAMVQAMQAEFGSRPISFGPALALLLAPAVMRWANRLLVRFRGRFARPDQFLAPAAGPGRPHLALPQANRQNLLRAGVPAAQIEMPGLCTACHTDLFFSHRAENGRTGRFGSIFLSISVADFRHARLQ
jgi:polyphenol oxidase